VRPVRARAGRNWTARPYKFALFIQFGVKLAVWQNSGMVG